MPSTPTSARALRKSLRLPRTYPRVARWLFDEPHLPFHSDAPLLTAHGFTASIVIQVRDQWQNFGNVFDPFQLEPFVAAENRKFCDVALDESVTSPANSYDLHAFSSSCVCDLDVVFTPVTYVASNIVVGYTFCSGSSFDREMLPTPRGTFRGRTHMYGRFAYDMDNDHTVILHHGLTPTVSGIVDITSNGLSRTRNFFSVPNFQYSSERLPLSPLSMVSVTELRAQYESLFSKSEFDMNSDNSFDMPQSLPDVRLRDGDINDNGGLNRTVERCSVRNTVSVSNNYMKDLMEITGKLNNLSYVLEGTYSGSNVCRIIVRNTETLGLRQMGSILTEHIALSKAARRECVCHVWQLYTFAAFGMRSERRGANLIVESSKTAKSHHCAKPKEQTEDSCRNGDCDQEVKSDRNKDRVSSKSYQEWKGKVKKKSTSRKRKTALWTENNLDRMKLSFLTDTVAQGG